MRVLFCGGSFQTPKTLVWKALDMVGDEIDISHVITPLQYGIDRHVTQWGNRRAVPVTQVAIPYGAQKGNGAGRMARMLRMFSYGIDVVIAIGQGEGTKLLLDEAAHRGIARFIWEPRLNGGFWDGDSLLRLEQLDLADPQ